MNLNETWLNENEIHLFNIPGYEAFHSVRGKVGGGVAIFVLSAFSNASLIESLEINNCNFLTVKISEFNFKICTAYRPPADDMISFADSNIDTFKIDSNVTKFRETFELNGYSFMNSNDKNFFTRLNARGITI